jgi:hypothetical protein
MLALFVTLIFLGLSAIDPIGIAIIPILLLQKHPYIRSFIFLSGSFLSLIIMGLLFAHGFGVIIMHFESTYAYLVTTLELIAGVILLIMAGVIFWRTKAGKLTFKPSASIKKRLNLNNWQLFGAGVLLVAIQSIADIVFVIAMIKIGQRNLSIITLALAVVVYALAALVLQIAVVIAFKLTPSLHRERTLDIIHRLLKDYSNQALIIVSFVLGLIFLAIAI